jgi:hypothetical protein
VLAPHRTHAFKQRSNVQDGRFRLPFADNLHADRQTFAAQIDCIQTMAAYSLARVWCDEVDVP